MKKLPAILALLLVPAHLCFAQNAAEYEMSVTALSQAVQVFEQSLKLPPEYDVVLRRDPMQSLLDGEGNIINTAGLHEGLTVQGIIWSEGFKTALVDDEFYVNGDQVGPYRILEIKEDGFDAEKDGKTIFVPLYTSSPNPPQEESEAV